MAWVWNDKCKVQGGLLARPSIEMLFATYTMCAMQAVR